MSDVSGCLGFQQMPHGYKLMLNRDRTHYYWLCYDGRESSICWDKWAVYRGAREDAASPKAQPKSITIVETS